MKKAIITSTAFLLVLLVLSACGECRHTGRDDSNNPQGDPCRCDSFFETDRGKAEFEACKRAPKNSELSSQTATADDKKFG